MADFAFRMERLLVTVSVIWHVSLHGELAILYGSVTGRATEA
jgi:hypothetical protein